MQGLANSSECEARLALPGWDKRDRLGGLLGLNQKHVSWIDHVTLERMRRLTGISYRSAAGVRRLCSMFQNTK